MVREIIMGSGHQYLNRASTRVCLYDQYRTCLVNLGIRDVSSPRPPLRRLCSDFRGMVCVRPPPANPVTMSRNPLVERCASIGCGTQRPEPNCHIHVAAHDEVGRYLAYQNPAMQGPFRTSHKTTLNSGRTARQRLVEAPRSRRFQVSSSTRDGG